MSRAGAWRDAFVLKAARFRRRFHPLTREFVVGRGGDGHIRRVLFCLPGSGNRDGIIAFLDAFAAAVTEVETDFLVPGGAADAYRCQLVPREIIRLGDDSFAFTGLPRKPLRERLIHHGYDLIIDCNDPPVPGTAYLVSLCENALRVGRSHPDAGLFYNIQVAPDRGTYFDIVLRVLDILNPA